MRKLLWEALSFLTDLIEMNNIIEQALLNSGFENEFGIILWAIRRKENSDIPDKKYLENVNWEELISLSQNHGTLSIVYKKLSLLEAGLIPEEVLSKFKMIYLQIVRFNMIQANQLIKVLSLLDQNKIKAFPIKGPVISQQAYGDIGYRTFQDLDLLINPEDFIRTYDLLTSEGYEPAIRFSEKWKKLWKKFRRDVEFRNGKTLIDLHQRFSQGNSSFDLTHEQIERTGTIEILENKIDVLSLEDTIIYLCINGTKDGWNKLRMVSELSFIIRSNPDLNWELIIDDSKKRGILQMVLSGLKFVSEILSDSLPDIIYSGIQKDERVKALSDKYISGSFLQYPDEKDPSIVRSIFKSLDSTFFKIKFLTYYLITPGAADLKAMKLPDFLSPLYYIMRLVRLLRDALSSPERKQKK